jgi:hypothetical protein
MDKQKITTGKIDSAEKKLKGLTDQGQVNFKCSNCDHELLVLQLVKTQGVDKANVLTRVAVKCGFCSGYSLVEQISGQFFPGAPNDDMMFEPIDVDTDSPQTDVLFEARNK